MIFLRSQKNLYLKIGALKSKFSIRNLTEVLDAILLKRFINHHAVA